MAEEPPCFGYTNIMYPEEMPSSQDRVRKISIARKLCEECHMQVQCLKLAVESRESNGVWGASTRLPHPPGSRRTAM
jgi:hypothetical protein